MYFNMYLYMDKRISLCYSSLVGFGESSFLWDPEKERANLEKHGIDFITASQVFKDPQRKIFMDAKHSRAEERYFCIGKLEERILTVRFTYRGGKIRILGAGYWRKGKAYYEEKEN